MSIRVNDVCFTCGEGKMVKLSSYPTIRGVRAYHFQCSVCKKNITLSGTTNVPEDIEYLKTEVITV
jgi:hypothetical protein